MNASEREQGVFHGKKPPKRTSLSASKKRCCHPWRRKNISCCIDQRHLHRFCVKFTEGSPDKDWKRGKPVASSSFVITAMEETSGFSFDLCKRNAMLQGAGMKLPKFTKTGTTIVGVVYKVRCWICHFAGFRLFCPPFSPCPF